MTKRQLNDTEKLVASKNCLIMHRELDYTNALIKRDETAVEIAPIMYEKQLADMKDRIIQEKADLEALQKAINITEDQIKNGVEQKEKKE
jgi:hypothetical protein